jgi:hypothetical protein
MKQKPIVLWAVLISAIGISGQQAANSGSAPADLVYTRPGQLVDVGGFRLNLYCMGTGSPTVVFDSGWGDLGARGRTPVLLAASYGDISRMAFARRKVAESVGLKHSLAT